MKIRLTIGSSVKIINEPSFSAGAKTQHRIVGGVETEENEYPWQVNLASTSLCKAG